MFPLARAVGTVYPPLYYSHLNSLAVELIEVGRIAEAHNISKIVLASPYVGAYPEYRETITDIEMRGRRASRSIVFIKQYNLPAQNVVQMPLAQQSSQISPLSDYQESARVFDLQKWKENMVKESNGDHKNNKPNKDMSQDEILYEIMNIFTESDMDLETRLEMLESIQKLAAKKRAKKQEKDKDKDPDQD